MFKISRVQKKQAMRAESSGIGAADGAAIANDGWTGSSAREGGVWLETTTTAGFVFGTCADHDKFVAFNETLGVDSGISAANTDGQELDDFLGYGEEARHWFERASAIIGV